MAKKQQFLRFQSRTVRGLFGKSPFKQNTPEGETNKTRTRLEQNPCFFGGCAMCGIIWKLALF